MQSMLPGWLVGRAVVSIFTASNESINQSINNKKTKNIVEQATLTFLELIA
jgi:hypothetical protein